MSTDLVIGLLGGGGLSAILAAVIAGLFSKRKLGAEATEIITRAASGVVEDLRKELGRAETKAEEVAAQHKEDLDRLRREFAQERENWRRVLQLHVAWDAIAIAKLGELGVELPPVPPLTPPQELDL